MKPVKTKKTNRNFKLVGGTEENDLPLEDNGEGVLISTWELDPEDRVALTTGKNIELMVWGSGHPPVLLKVED